MDACAVALGPPRDLDRVRPVLAALEPALVAAPLRAVPRRHDGDLAPSETVLVGDTHVLKVAWTATDAVSLRRQRVALEALDLPVATPRVIAATDAPEAFLYAALPGRALTWETAAALTRPALLALADNWAAMLAALQTDAMLRAVEAAAGRPRAAADLRGATRPAHHRERMIALYVLLDLGDISRRLRRSEPVVGGADARLAAIPRRLGAARHALGQRRARHSSASRP